MNKQGSIVAAWGGHLVDLYRLARFDVRNPHSYAKLRQIKALARRCGAKMMIETGTYLGNTAMRCSSLFDRVFTIELDPALYQQASRYLAPRKNVECIEGDGLKMLPAILARADVSNVLVFLDGHFSMGLTAHGDVAEPACLEVEVLAKYQDKIAGVIIDDFRTFGSAAGYPLKSELFRSIEQNFGDAFDCTVHLDQVLVWRKR